MLKKILPAMAALAAAYATAQTWNETFEAGSKTTYAEGDVACVMGSWHFVDGLLGSSPGDRYFGAQGVRLRTGRIEMNFDKTNGAETVSAFVARYGTDGDSAVTVEGSVDGGSTWFQAGAPIAVTSAVLEYVSVPVHTNGSVRFRISKGGANRVNIDDVRVSDFGTSGVPPLVGPVGPKSVRVGQTLSFALPVTATDGDPVTATNVSASAGVTGLWELSGGVFAYAPSAEDIGQRSFSFTASDKDGASEPAEVAVTVRRVQKPAVRMSEAFGCYAQDFDGLSTNGSANVWDDAAEPLAAWYATANTAAVESYRAGSGSGTAGGLYSFGPEGSTNRSLGTLAGSGTTYRFGVALTNETGQAITNLTVSFVAVQWRVANGATNTLSFEYCITNGVPPLGQGCWTAVPELGFDSPVVTNAEQSAGAVCVAEARCAAIAGPVPAGMVVVLRWQDPDDAGSDHAFGIDDLVVTWAAERTRCGTVLAVR